MKAHSSLNGGSDPYTFTQRWVALGWGIACHAIFAVGVTLMIMALYCGLSSGHGPFRGTAAAVANILLGLQFAALHSLTLTKKGRTLLSRLPLAGIGPELVTTTFAILASVQIFVTFWFWSPSGTILFQPQGWMHHGWTVVYGAAWIYVLLAMWYSGLGLQTGFLGWWAVWKQRKPRYPRFGTKGLYRHTRQPIYFGFALVLWTAPTWTLDHIVLTLIWTTYCVTGPLFKERRYRRYYGDDYHSYAARVSYWIPLPRRVPAPAQRE